MSRCNSTWRARVFFAAWLLAHSSASAEELLARVTADRVNLRARSELTAEVVAQVDAEERLAVVSLQNEWVEVVPPDSVDVWAHRDFVKDGVSTVKSLNLRAGPGINYSIVGSVSRGEPVPVRGQFGEWLKVAPSNATLWVSREFVDVVSRVPSVQAAAPLGPLPAAEPLLESGASGPPSALAPLGPAVTADPPPPAPAQPPPADLNLVPLPGQGREVRREGELKPAPYLFGRPSAFRLVRREGVQQVTVCYVRGNTAQLNSLLNESLIVHGREYWVQGVKQSVVVLERIERRAP